MDIAMLQQQKVVARESRVNRLKGRRRRVIYLQLAEQSQSAYCQEFLLKSGDGLTAQVLLLNPNLDNELRGRILGSGVVPREAAEIRGSRPGGLEWSARNYGRKASLAAEARAVVGELGELTGANWMQARYIACTMHLLLDLAPKELDVIGVRGWELLENVVDEWSGNLFELPAAIRGALATE